MKLKYIYNFCAIITMLFLLTSCRKDFSPYWESELLAPIVKTSLSINDIIADSLLEINPDQSLSLVYRNSVYSFSVDSLIKFPDTITNSYFNIPFTINAQPGQTLINASDTKKLKFGSAGITIADVHSGYVTLKVNNTLNEAVICTYKIPSATRNGVCFEISEYIPPSGNGIFLKQFDVSGYHLDLRGPSGASNNRLSTVITAKIDPNGNPVQITPQDTLIIYVGFEDLQFDYAKGYFGNSSYSFGPDSSSFSLFKKITDGTIDLEQVKATLSVENSFGIDGSVIFNNLTAINTRTGHSVSLASPLIGKPINITRAIETPYAAAPVQPSIFNYNLSGSNIAALIETMPDKISYSADINANPLGNVSGGNDFFYYGYGLKSYVDIEIPLSVIAGNLTLADTVNFNPGESFENIIDGNFKLTAANGFPFSAKIQIYLLNNSGQVSDSLFANNIIEAAPLNASYIVTNVKTSIINIPVPSEKADKLRESSRMVIKAIFNTASQSHHVRLYNNYHLDLNLSGDFNYIFNTEN